MRRLPRASAGVALALLIAGCGDDDDEATPTTASTTSPPAAGSAPSDGAVTTAAPLAEEEPGDAVRIIELAFVEGEVTTGGGRVKVGAGEVVTLEVTSDVDEEVHVHGYDIEVPVTAGETTPIDIVGDLPGVWEVELHGSGTLLAELAVAG